MPALVDETLYVPSSIEQARRLYFALVDSGTSVHQSRGIVTWLLVLPASRADDPSPDSLRARYRRSLLQLGSPPWGVDEDTVGEHGSTGIIRDGRHNDRRRRDRRKIDRYSTRPRNELDRADQHQLAS